MFYANHFEGNTAHFDAAEKRHIVDALRKKTGDLIEFTDGNGHLFEACIKEIGKDRVSADMTRQLDFKPRPSVHLAIAPTKNSDRVEWMLEKCCELGLASIQFLQCAHSEKIRVNITRLERVALSAIKQSGNLWMPDILPPVPFSSWVHQNFNGKRYLAHCAEGHKQNAEPAHGPVSVAIGPEGDFSAEEITLALESGLVPLSLGNTRLRTETAGMVACTLFNLL